MKCVGQSRMMSSLLRWWLFTSFACACAAACSYSSSPIIVGKSFSVSVRDRGRAVVGLQIALTNEGRKKDSTVAILKTDAKGSVGFKHVRPGLYFVGIKHPAFGYSDEIRVMPHPPKGSPEGLEFEWPGWKPLSTTTISGSISGVARTDRGILLDRTKPTYTSVNGARLTLLKAVSEEPVEIQISNESGNFEFHPVLAGLYFLRVETPISKPSRWIYPKDGYVPIEVDPSSAFSSLDMVLDNAICGELAWGRQREGSANSSPGVQL